MHLKNQLILTFSALFLFSACKKKDDQGNNQPVPHIYNNYSCLIQGNYWIYELYQVDSNGNGTSMNVFDSVYVAGDTSCNGNVYHKLMKPMYAGSSDYSTEFLRDSLSYTVDIYGNIWFSSEDFTNVFKSGYFKSNVISPIDSVGYFERKMADKDMQITVAGKTYTTRDFQEIWHMHPYFWDKGQTRILHHRYAAYKGIITETLPFYISDPNYTERRLVRSVVHIPIAVQQ